jgi:hypothetical protein
MTAKAVVDDLVAGFDAHDRQGIRARLAAYGRGQDRSVGVEAIPGVRHDFDAIALEWLEERRPTLDGLGWRSEIDDEPFGFQPNHERTVSAHGEERSRHDHQREKSFAIATAVAGKHLARHARSPLLVAEARVSEHAPWPV